MPGRDGTGPRGMGSCGMGGRGRRNGGGAGGCGRGMGMGRGFSATKTPQVDKAALANRAEILRAELAEVEKSLNGNEA